MAYSLQLKAVFVLLSALAFGLFACGLKLAAVFALPRLLFLPLRLKKEKAPRYRRALL